MLREALGLDGLQCLMRIDKQATRTVMENVDTVHLHIRRPVGARLRTALALTAGARDVALTVSFRCDDLPLMVPPSEHVTRLTMRPEGHIPWTVSRLKPLVQGLTNLTTITLDTPRPTMAFARAASSALAGLPRLTHLVFTNHDDEGFWCGPMDNAVMLLGTRLGARITHLTVPTKLNMTMLDVFPVLEELTVQQLRLWDIDVAQLNAHPCLRKLHVNWDITRIDHLNRFAPWLRRGGGRQLHVARLMLRKAASAEDIVVLHGVLGSVHFGTPCTLTDRPDVKTCFALTARQPVILLMVLRRVSPTTLVRLDGFADLTAPVLAVLPPHVEFWVDGTDAGLGDDMLRALPTHMRSVSVRYLVDAPELDRVRCTVDVLPASGLRANATYTRWM